MVIHDNVQQRTFDFFSIIVLIIRYNLHFSFTFRHFLRMPAGKRLSQLLLERFLVVVRTARHPTPFAPENDHTRTVLTFFKLGRAQMLPPLDIPVLSWRQNQMTFTVGIDDELVKRFRCRAVHGGHHELCVVAVVVVGIFLRVCIMIRRRLFVFPLFLLLLLCFPLLRREFVIYVCNNMANRGNHHDEGRVRSPFGVHFQQFTHALRHPIHDGGRKRRVQLVPPGMQKVRFLRGVEEVAAGAEVTIYVRGGKRGEEAGERGVEGGGEAFRSRRI
mmetsp:Transcript_1606/g.3516  ORF Transcript_1606/g.3516 Transcript_1606/m.3516 type:complete len:274 (-) Transcript_1606:478-1299(-)